VSIVVAVVFGFIFGLTEILPLSGSGHLHLLMSFFHISLSSNDMALMSGLFSLGASLTVFVIFFGDISAMIRQTSKIIVNGVEERDGRPAKIPPPVRLTLMVGIAAIPVIISTLLIKKDALTDNRLFLSIAVIITGIILFVSCMPPKGKKASKTMTVSDALIMGIGYGVSTLPGLSTPALVLASGTACGVKKQFALRFCMLIYFPITFISSVLKIGTALLGTVSGSLIPAFALGFVSSAIGALIALSLYGLIVKRKYTLRCSYYCLILGAVTMILGFIIR